MLVSMLMTMIGIGKRRRRMMVISVADEPQQQFQQYQQAPLQDNRHSFQIVWSQLSFEVDLSTYDKLINNLFTSARTVYGFTSNSCFRFSRPRQQQQHQLPDNDHNQRQQANKYALAGSEPSSAATTLSMPKSLPLSRSSNDSIATWSEASLKSAATTANKRVIFDNLNGYVNSGEITAILGPSGAGKTSLLNAICGKTNNYGGRIELLGGSGSFKHKRMRLSIIPQKDYLIENLTVRENLLYSSRILNVDSGFDHEANIERVVKMLNLTACFNSVAANISGGEYKRVSIGQELLRQPDMLVLDEPTSGLDSLNCKNLIKSLAQLIEASRVGQLKPIAILMTIHQPDVDIFNMFDHVYCMARGGRIIFDGHPRDAMHTVLTQGGNFFAASAASANNSNNNSNSNNNNNNSEQTQHDGNAAVAAATAVMATTNPANLLIEIASEDVYGQELIDRLASYQRKQFEQTMLALASGRCSSNSPDSGSAQRVNQLQANLLSANELALDPGKLSSPSFNVIKRIDSRLPQISTTTTTTATTGQPQQIAPPTMTTVTATTQPPTTPPYSLSSTSLASSYTGNSRQSSSNQLNASQYGTQRSQYKSQQLIRDKRLNAKHDHSGLFWYHTSVLAQRAFVSTLRDPLMTLISLLFHLSIPFVMWTVYSRRIGTTSACPTIQRDMDIVSMASNRTAARLGDLQDQLITSYECSTMFFLTTYSFSMCSLTVASLAFPLNMHILLKEVRNGWYQLPSYVVAKTLANFPFEVIFPVVSLIMIYLMLGMPSSSWEWRLWAIALVMACVAMISHTQGLIFGALCMDSVQTAIFLASASSLPQTLLSGFTARIKHMPVWLQNMSWLSQYRYSSDLINMIRYGFGICPCDSSTDHYLHNHQATFKDIPNNLKPIFIYYISQQSTTTGGNNTTDDEPTTTAASIANSTIISNLTTTTMKLATNVANVGSSPTELQRVNEIRVTGVDYELMLNDTERSELIERMVSNEVDLFGQMADLMGRSFTFGRKLDGCESVRSQLLVTAGTPQDDYLPIMLGCMFALLLASKLILFLVVRYKIGSRI